MGDGGTDKTLFFYNLYFTILGIRIFYRGSPIVSREGGSRNITRVLSDLSTIRHEQFRIHS